MVKVTLPNGHEMEVPAMLFRRVLTSAAWNLEALARNEGSKLPLGDRKALRVIRDMQFHDCTLI